MVIANDNLFAIVNVPIYYVQRTVWYLSVNRFKCVRMACDLNGNDFRPDYTECPMICELFMNHDSCFAVTVV